MKEQNRQNVSLRGLDMFQVLLIIKSLLNASVRYNLAVPHESVPRFSNSRHACDFVVVVET